MRNHELEETARTLVADGKGILAADESPPTVENRFRAVGLPSTEENRRAWRELLFTTSGVERYIRGVILYDETIRQSASDGTSFPTLLSRRGILPGIKVDAGAKPLAGFPGEKITEGLDGLRERLAGYRLLGARFAKWRAVIAIGGGIPTRYCLRANARMLGLYAALCVEAGIVPVVEPEVLMEGAHDIGRCEAVTTEALGLVFGELREAGVPPEGLLLKPNMVVPGRDSSRKASEEEIVAATLRSLRRTVPAAVPGIVFLSGGQRPEEATARLNALNAAGPHPWRLSFSFSRALQDPVLRAWGGKPENAEEARRIFLRRAELNGAAATGRYSADMERKAA